MIGERASPAGLPPRAGPLLAALSGHVAARPPIWLMRQAGRYLPEYRALRATAPSFLAFCYDPVQATEVTLQPIRRFGFDAAILFSDILVVPDAMGLGLSFAEGEGPRFAHPLRDETAIAALAVPDILVVPDALGQAVSFETGHGPRLAPIADEADLDRLRDELDLDKLAPVFETIARVRRTLPRETALLGFCGAPWTVASYMVAGKGTPDQAPARLFAYRHPAVFQRLIDRLVDASVAYLAAQRRAGVDAVQVFDSWAGVLPTLEYERWCLAPLRAIVARLKHSCPDLPVIAFPRANGRHLVAAADGTVAALGLDIDIDVDWANRVMPKGLTLQGNLDPLALLAGGGALDRAVDRILGAFSGRPHIFNLGHGILPETPIAHVEQLMRRVRG